MPPYVWKALEKMSASFWVSASMALCNSVEILKKVGITGGNVNSCLYMEKSASGVEYIALYVDDNLILGSSNAVS